MEAVDDDLSVPSEGEKVAHLATLRASASTDGGHTVGKAGSLAPRISVISELPQLCDHRCSRFVVRENNLVRLAWNAVLVVLLLYTATIFPFRLAYLDFKIPGLAVETSQIDWTSVDWVTNILFWVDLFASFFFSYRDGEDREVLDLPRVVAHYVCGNFPIDLVASIPPEWIEVISTSASAGTSGSQFVRLLRLIRLTRLVKLVSFMSSSPFWRWLQTLKGVRLINFTIGFLLIVHLMACSWYLCAALHERQDETWIGRRMVYSGINTEGVAVTMPLLDAGSVEQWFHSMYFTLVVFSTVGFGDISATTLGEIVVVCSMMVIGAVVHSILVSRMIHVITNADAESSELAAKRALAVRFAQHVELNEEQQKDLARCIVKSNSLESFDQDQVQKLMRSVLPENVMVKLHKLMFHGRLLRNRFIATCAGKGARLPTRFPLQVAAMLQPQEPEGGEMLFQWRDNAWTMYIVLTGTLAFVAKPQSTGGVCEVFVASEAEHAAGSISPQAIYPYLLYGPGTYVGEFEMLVTKPRGSGLRCETAGHLLTLAKSDFTRLVEDFPDYGALWKDATLRKEGHRKAALKKLVRGRRLRDFAAYTIQVHLSRKHKLSSDNGASRGSGRFFQAQQDMPRASCESPRDVDLRMSLNSTEFGEGGTQRASSAVNLDELEATMRHLRAELETLREEQRTAHSEIMARLAVLFGGAAEAPGRS